MPDITLGGHVYDLDVFRNYFIDPNTLTVYPWHVNHKPDGDKGTAKKRNIELTANTGNVGLVRQQGDTEPIVLKREGTLITLDQEEQMWKWFQLCESQTIYFVEFSGDAYEVQITSFSVQKIGTGGPTRNGERFYATYEIELEVYKVLAGVLATAGITP
jgi:hypothetical protein